MQPYLYYTDANCTNAVEAMSVYRGVNTCTAPPVSTYTIKYPTPAAGQCSVAEVHELGAAILGQLYQNFGSCAPVNDEGLNAYYRIGAVVPESSLATATLVTDP